MCRDYFLDQACQKVSRGGRDCAVGLKTRAQQRVVPEYAHIRFQYVDEAQVGWADNFHLL